MPEAIDLDLCRGYCASESHKWGLAPMHYQDEYYINVLEQIKEALIKMRYI